MLMNKLSAIYKSQASQFNALCVFKSIWQQFIAHQNTCYLQTTVQPHILELTEGGPFLYKGL